ncbi:MAG: tyrosine-type recombinase/integrase [Acidobacteria bacterium]|nr:tyrosine-type recombinase/integrase [Acidobacteriota bacterium]
MSASERGQGRIYKQPRSKYWWIGYRRRGKEIRESSGSTDEQVARRLLKHRLREVANDRDGIRPFVGPAAERVLVSELLDALTADFKLRGVRSLDKTLSHMKPVRMEFGDMRAVQVTAERVDAYAESRLAAEAAPSTCNREIALLGQAFKLAFERGRIGARPKLRKLSEQGRIRQGFFEQADFERLVSNLPDDLQGFARFGFFSGWRKGEVSSLRWQDVDRAEKIIRLRPEHSKNGQGRLLALEGELWAVIERQWEARTYRREDGTDSVSPLVFHRGGIAVKEFRKSWASACKAANVPGMLFHDLRRSAVRNMIRAGVPERVAMSISGHKTRSIFDRYNIVSEADIRQAVTRTQRYLEGIPAAQKVVNFPSK